MICACFCGYLCYLYTILSHGNVVYPPFFPFYEDNTRAILLFPSYPTTIPPLSHCYCYCITTTTYLTTIPNSTTTQRGSTPSPSPVHLATTPIPSIYIVQPSTIHNTTPKNLLHHPHLHPPSQPISLQIPNLQHPIPSHPSSQPASQLDKRSSTTISSTR